MRSLIVVAMLVALCLAVGVTQAGDVNRGKILAFGCSCHGDELNGMDEKKILGKLLSFKKGKGSKTMVNQVESLSKKDLEDLAAFFAAQ